MNSFLLLSSNGNGGLWATFIGLMGLYGFIIFAAIAMAALPIIIEFILKAIALNKMSQNAGFAYPWLSFIPFGQIFVEFLLPKKPFELWFIKSKDRRIMAVLTILLTYPGLLGAVAANVLPVMGQIVAVVIPILAYVMNWRKKYDLLSTFHTEKNTVLLISILGTIFPIIYAITLLVFMNNKPEYGFGKLYAFTEKE